MALTSKFATAKFLAAPKPKTFVPGQTTIGKGLLSQALGPQAVNTPTGAPAATPAAPVNPSVLPPDAGYEATVGGLVKNHDATQAGLVNQKQQALLNYGYDYVNGTLTFDPRDPFSQAAMLKRNYNQAQTGNTNSYAARGQLYSGALQNAQNESGFQFQKGNDTLTKALTDFLAGNTAALNQNDTDLEIGLGRATGDRLNNAADNPLYAPSAVPDAAPAGPLQDTNAATPAFKTIPWKDSAGNPGVLHIWPDGRRVFVRS
jgi:hypothetical protein